MMAYSLPSSSSKSFNKELTATIQASPTPSLSPPIELLEYYPLSVYLNGILTTFNLIRVCCPLSVTLWLPQELKRSLESSSSIIATYHSIEEPAFTVENRKSFQLYCNAFVSNVFSHMNKCSNVLLSKSLMRTSLGQAFDITCTRDSLIEVVQLINSE